MALHHTTPFALCVAEPNQSQSNVPCLPLVMKDDMHHHHHHLHDYDRMPKMPTNGKSAWTDAATDCLIDVFEEKWNSLRRGNLKAKNWDEVAMELGTRCGVPKTGDQCRHKIEKLRGKFRQEKVVANFGQSKWLWYERLNQMFGDGVRRVKAAAADYDGAAADKCAVMEVRTNTQADTFQQADEVGLGQHHHHRDRHGGGMEDKNEKGDTSYTSHSHKSDGGSARNGRSGKRRKSEASELGAAMKFLGDTLLKIEECKMELQKDNERLRLEMESRRLQMQDIELKRTEMLVQMELKRTEMLCDLELRRTKMQMDLFEMLASKSKKS